MLNDFQIMVKNIPDAMKKRKQPLTGDQEIYLPLLDDDNFDEEYAEPLETYVISYIILQANMDKTPDEEEEEDKESYKTIARVIELGSSRLVIRVLMLSL